MLYQTKSYSMNMATQDEQIYCLVYWIDDKSTNVFAKHDLVFSPSTQDDESKVRSIKYENKFYKAKILKESDSEKWLRSLKISKDGQVLPRERARPQTQASKFAVMKTALESRKQKNAEAKLKKEAAMKRNTSILQEKHEKEKHEKAEKEEEHFSQGIKNTTKRGREYEKLESVVEVARKKKRVNKDVKETSADKVYDKRKHAPEEAGKSKLAKDVENENNHERKVEQKLESANDARSKKKCAREGIENKKRTREEEEIKNCSREPDEQKKRAREDAETKKRSREEEEKSKRLREEEVKKKRSSEEVEKKKRANEDTRKKMLGWVN